MNAVKFFSTLILAALLVQAVHALDTTSPKNIGASKVFIELHWAAVFNDGIPNSFTFRTFGFPTTSNQEARMESGGNYAFTKKSDKYGNELIEYSFSPSKTTENMVMRASVDIDYANAPVSKGGESAYSAQTSLTQPSAGITAKAAELAAGSSGDVETLVRLTDWVHNRVRYDGPGYGGSIQSARWVFDNTVGTCDEYSHLLISMLRSVNIPAKFVAGYVCSFNCSEAANWGPHAWVEAYAEDRWMASDPTFNEALVLDATHVKFAQGTDQNDIKENLAVTPHSYSPSDITITREADIQLDEARAFPKLIELTLTAPTETLGEGAFANVTATIKSLSDKPLAVPLLLLAPVETAVIGALDSLVYLPPGGELSRTWQVVLPNKLQKSFLYSFPLKVSALGEEQEATLAGQEGGESPKTESLHVTDLDPRLLPDGTLLVRVQVLNTGQEEVRNAKAALSTNAGNAERPLNIGAGSRATLEFILNPGGLKTITGTLQIDDGDYQLKQPVLVSLPDQTPAPTVTAEISDRSILASFEALWKAILRLFGLK